MTVLLEVLISLKICIPWPPCQDHAHTMPKCVLGTHILISTSFPSLLSSSLLPPFLLLPPCIPSFLPCLIASASLYAILKFFENWISKNITFLKVGEMTYKESRLFALYFQYCILFLQLTEQRALLVVNQTTLDLDSLGAVGSDVGCCVWPGTVSSPFWPQLPYSENEGFGTR